MPLIDIRSVDDTMGRFCYASTKDFVIDKYYRQGASISDICHRTDWSEDFFIQLMQQFNLPIREKDNHACQKCKD